jgi:hypothetical protein
VAYIDGTKRNRGQIAILSCGEKRSKKTGRNSNQKYVKFRHTLKKVLCRIISPTTNRPRLSTPKIGNRNSCSKTDPDATFMYLKDDHMQNGQLKAAYNLQIGTENQFISHFDFFPNPADFLTFKPFVNGFRERFEGKFEKVLKKRTFLCVQWGNRWKKLGKGNAQRTAVLARL